MRIRKFLLAAVSLFTVGLVSLSQFSFAGTWTSSEPGYKYSSQLGWFFGSNYTAGMPEWFMTPNNYDTAYCDVCASYGSYYCSIDNKHHGLAVYHDYRDSLRTRFDQNLWYVRLSLDKGYYKTYHRHFGRGNTGSNWDIDKKWYFVDGNSVQYDTEKPTVNSTTISGGWQKWYSSAPTITVSAKDTGGWFTAGMGSPGSGGTGVNHVYLEMSNGQKYYSPNGQSTAGGSGASGNFTNTWQTPGSYQVNNSYAIDNGKNVGKSGVWQWFGYDDAAPGMNESHNTAPNQPSVTISLSTWDTNSNGTGGSGVNRIERWDGSRWVTIAWATSATYTVTANGTYKFRAVDNVGRTVEKSVVINNIDGVPPTVKVTWSKKPLRQDTLIVSATDNCGVISGYMITETNVKPKATDPGWQASGTFTNRATENKPYYCWAKDPAGNVGSAIADVKSLDLYKPQIDNVQVEGG